MSAKHSGRETTPAVSDVSDMVTIQIPTGKKFQVPAPLLAHHSKYFRAALNSPMKEATTHHFDLVEHAHENVVGLFITWIYSRSLPGYNHKNLLPDTKYRDGSISNLLVQAWLLGDYLQVVEFKNDVLRLVLETFASISASYHPFFQASPTCKDLNANSSLFRLLTAILGRKLYTNDERNGIKGKLDMLGTNARVAVMEYMVLYSATLLAVFKDFQLDLNRKYLRASEDGINERKAETLDDGVKKIKEGCHDIRVEDFFEKKTS